MTRRFPNRSRLPYYNKQLRIAKENLKAKSKVQYHKPKSFGMALTLDMSISKKAVFPYRGGNSLDFWRAISVLAWIDEPRSDQTRPCGLSVIVNIPATDQLLTGHPKSTTVPSRPVSGTDSTLLLSMQLRKYFWLYAEHWSFRGLLLWRYLVIGRILSFLSSLQEIERTLFRIIWTSPIQNYIVLVIFNGIWENFYVISVRYSFTFTDFGFDLVWILKGSIRARLWWKSRT